MKMNANGGTFLGHAIRYAGLLLKNRPEKHKIFICLTDGAPCSDYYKSVEAGLNDCRYAVRDIEKFADVIGIGLYYDEETKKVFEYIFQKDAVTMSSLNSLTKRLPEKMKKLMQQ